MEGASRRFSFLARLKSGPDTNLIVANARSYFTLRVKCVLQPEGTSKSVESQVDLKAVTLEP
jgi:hypothetical protein